MKWVSDRRLVTWVIVLTALAVYLPAILRGSFHYDDTHSIVDNEGIRTLANVPRFFAEPQLWSAEPGNAMYRPVLLVTFAADYALWGYDVHGWLLTNVLFHALAAVLVHRLALRLGLSPLTAAFAAAVFVLHPAISEVQNYASSRSESVMAALFLGALILHVRGGTRNVALAFLLFCAAQIAKENAAPFCAVVGFYELIWREGPLSQRLRRAVLFGLLYAAPAVVFLFVVRPWLLKSEVLAVALVDAPQGVDPLVGGGRSYVDNVITQLRVQVLYLQLMAKPVGLSADHDVAVTAPVAKIALAVAIHLAGFVVAVRSALSGHRLVALCIAWWWMLGIVTFLQPLNVVMNEHRLYLPMIAVALLGGAGLARVTELLAVRWNSWSRAASVAATPLVCFAALVVDRSSEWRDDETLWSSAIERAPQSAWAHLHLGAVWHERANDTSGSPEERLRLYDKALAEYEISEKLHPAWANVQLNIGNASVERGRITHDRADFERALAAFLRFGEIVGADSPRPKIFQAVAYAELGELDRAIAMIQALKAKDSSVTRLYDDQIAHFQRRKGDKRAAAETMERVIAIDKEDRVDGLLELGWWYFEDGDLATSEKYLTRALDIAKAKSHDLRPPLYVARFLGLVHQPGAEDFERMAISWGWRPPPGELEWVHGGRTPGVSTGTAGLRKR